MPHWSAWREACPVAYSPRLRPFAEDLFAHAQECAYRMLALELFPRFWDAIKSQDAPRPSSYSVKLTEYSCLKDVLSDEKGVMFFSEYCKTHYCEEQVLFWLEARDHQLLFDPSDMLSQGLLIFDTYVKLSAEYRINISATATEAVEARLSSGSVDRTLFDEVSQEVPLAPFEAQACSHTVPPLTCCRRATAGGDVPRAGPVAALQGSGHEWRV